MRVASEDKTAQAMVATRTPQIQNKVLGEQRNAKKFKQAGELLRRIASK